MLSLIQKSGPSSEAPNLRLKMISDNLVEKNGQSLERFVTDGPTSEAKRGKRIRIILELDGATNDKRVHNAICN